MKRRLNQPIEQILDQTRVPTPDLNFTKAAQRQTFLAAAKSQPTRLHLWRQARTVLNFASLVFLILIGGGTLLAQANRALPGQTLYQLGRSLERTRLALTTGEQSKLSLQIDYADERLAEMVEVARIDNLIKLPVAIDEAEAALTQVDSKLDNAKLMLELGRPSEFTRAEVAELSNKFRVVLQDFAEPLSEVESASPSIENVAKLGAINDILQVELSPLQGELSNGYYLKLDGELSNRGSSLRIGEFQLSLSGRLTGQIAADETVEVTGVVVGSDLNVYQIRRDFYQLSLSDEQVAFAANGVVLHEDDMGFFIGDDTTHVNLIGLVGQSQRLRLLVGQTIDITGVWQGEAGVQVIRASTETPEGTLEIVGEPNSGDESEAGNELPTDTNQRGQSGPVDPDHTE